MLRWIEVIRKKPAPNWYWAGIILAIIHSKSFKTHGTLGRCQMVTVQIHHLDHSKHKLTDKIQSINSTNLAEMRTMETVVILATPTDTTIIDRINNATTDLNAHLE